MSGLNFTEEKVTFGTPPPEPAQMEEIIIPSAVVTPEPTKTPTEPSPTPEVSATEPTPAPPTPVAGEFKPEVIFGEEYDSLDKVKAELQAAKELKGKVTEYESKLKETVVEDPYIRSLIDWTKQGKDRSLHDLVYASDPSKMTPEQKVAMKLQVDTGLSPQEASEYVTSKYMIGEDFDESDPQVRKARLELKIDSTTADKELSQWRAKQMEAVPEFDYQAQAKSWEPHIQATVNTVKELELPNGTKFPVPQTVLEGVQNHIKTVLTTEGVEMNASDPEQQKMVQSIAMDYIKARSFEDAMKYLTIEMEKAKIKESSVIPPTKPTTPHTPGKGGTHGWMSTAAPLKF